MINKLQDKRIIITGCGYKPVTHVFHDIVTDKPSHNEILVDGKKNKLNIGAATALILAQHGATVHMVSRSEKKLDILREYIVQSTGCSKDKVEYSVVDVCDEGCIQKWIHKIPKNMTTYWVQSVGLGAGAYKIKDDNPYLPLEDIPLGLLEAETMTVLKSTHVMMKALLPLFKSQKETRISIITSMSEVRCYTMGGTHTAAKGAIGNYANSARIGLYKDNIYITIVRPGAVDTGMYDSPVVQEAVITTSNEYGGIWNKQITLAPPTSVGQGIAYALTTDAHIPSINLVAKGQFPHEGS